MDRETMTSYEVAAPRELRTNAEASSSGVAWGAVAGGAFVAAAFYLILLALGAGFGLSAISPWPGSGASASALGVAAIVWLVATQFISNALGGYMTGRLRTKWALIHTDEVFFRDTANGFLSWAVSLVMGVAILGSAAAFMAGGAAQVPGPEPSTASRPADPNAYFVDELLRSTDGRLQSGVAAERGEVQRLLINALSEEQMSPADQNYLAYLVAARTGLAPADAERRVTNVIADARQKADTVRKITARLLLWSFLALLIGALSASYFATVGGRLRDHVRAV